MNRIVEQMICSVRKSIDHLNRFERGLWGSSVGIVTASFLLSNNGDWMTLLASLIGVTALIFVAKGDVLGQILTVVFSIFYSVISFFFAYYGEMITYMGMTAPIAVLSVVAWLRNPYAEKQVEISTMTFRKLFLTSCIALAVTIAFYFILAFFNTANLLFSTISITTSFMASALMLLRSPYYAVAYAANDIVLIILWVLASMENAAYTPMVACFAIFFINDLYGFRNWMRMKTAQRSILQNEKYVV